MKPPIIKMRCNKCGKEPKLDENQSNENWDVIPNIPCECGGKLEFCLEQLDKLTIRKEE